MHRLPLTFVAALGLCACSAEAGSDGVAGGAPTEFPAVCPGYETTPGAGCPAPCEPLVPGGPDGRAYCTKACDAMMVQKCRAGQTCGWADGFAETGEAPDACLPGRCDPAMPTGCPDDFRCTEQQFCYPAPGTKRTQCMPYEVESQSDCQAPCDRTFTLSSGRLLCTAACSYEPERECAAGADCQAPDVNSDEGICVMPCDGSTQCPGTTCNYLHECDF
jgi:hypothetical protein